MTKSTRMMVATLALMAASVAQAEQWNLVKDEDGIKVYLSEVAGSPYKAYRGVTQIKAEMPKLLALQNDAVGSCKWIHECKSQKLLKQEGDVYWVYSQFNTPWPVTPRDSVMKVTSKKASDGTVTRSMQGAPNDLPPTDGMVRVSKVDGSWTFTPKASGVVEVVYQVHTEPGGSVPSWLANKFVVEAPFNTLKAYRTLAEQP
ncbi:START domain-containing protein [Pseudomonas sp.]|uniref:START domain-containing protein n=1 Tax=Pseudomonas sp. TaxID=306 RepID=UPI00257E787E|nr:START domain-containing protein [Pseudomonas sp.]